MTSRTPPLLEPYLRLPPETSLIVLTGVLGASTNWLVQRYIHSFLATPSRGATAGDDGHGVAGDPQASILLVSYLRDYAFWKDGAGRTGVDLDALSRKGRFAFVDALSGLFSGPRLVPDGSKGGRVLPSATLQDLRRSLDESVAELQQQSPESNIVLILDSPDLLLAATGNKVSGEALREALLDIREVSACYS
jgi:elongator complex protein 6